MSIDGTRMSQLPNGGPFQIGDMLLALRSGANIQVTPATISLGVLNALDYGVTGDGVTNDVAAINALFIEAAADNRTVYFPDGVYLCGVSSGSVNNGQINLVSGLRVTCSPNARFRRNFRSTGVTGFLGQASYTVKISGVSWSGGILESPDNTVLTYSGNMVGVYGDDLVFDSLRIDTFGGTGGGRAYAVAGDRIRIYNPYVVNPNPATGNGGIRVLAGDGFICMGGYVESGDDVFQFVPTNAVSTAVFADSDITNGMYIGCVGFSYEARLCIVAVGNQTGEVGDLGFPTCVASVTDCSFVSVKGTGAGKAVLIQNTDSSGIVERITFANCTFGGAVDATLDGTLTISGWLCGGGVDSIDFNGCSIVDVAKIGLLIDGRATGGGLPTIRDYNVSNVHWDGGRIEAPADLSSVAVKVMGARTISFENMVIVAAGNEAMMIGQGGDSATTAFNLALDQVTIAGISDAQYGIKFQWAQSCSVTKCAFISATGATDARAIYNGTSSAYYTVMRDCDLSQLTGTPALFIGNPFVNGSSYDNCRPLPNPNTPTKYKTTDETRTSTATLANDSQIVGLTALASSYYVLSGVIEFDEGGGGGNFKFQLVLTGSGATMDFTVVNEFNASAGAAISGQSARHNGSSVITSTAANRRMYVIKGVVFTGVNNATIDLQWAQNASNITGCTVYQGSYLSLQRMTA